MAPSRRPTLATVAAEVGVSAMTVSNVYNRPAKVSAALLERVLETAGRLGYPGPDPVGAGLRRRRVGAIGVLFEDPLPHAFADASLTLLLRGVSQACEEERIGLVLVP